MSYAFDDRRETPVADPETVAGRLDLLIRDFARVVNGVVAFVSELGPERRAQLVSSWGIDGPVTIDVPNRGGRRRVDRRSEEGGCFVGRALVHGRPAFDTLDVRGDADLVGAAPVALTHAMAVPVESFDGRGSKVLVAGFSTPPIDLPRAFWLANSYARMVALIEFRRDALSELLHGARRDGLTGCLTYDSVLHELIREINRSARGALPLSCCFVDLDGFKRINDQHGHIRGNQVLAEVGLLLRKGVRSCDTVGRYGGDEFVVILPQTGEAEAVVLADRVRSLIATGHNAHLDGLLTMSAGVAEWAPGLSGEQLLDRADSALFAAKAKGCGVLAHKHAKPAAVSP